MSDLATFQLKAQQIRKTDFLPEIYFRNGEYLRISVRHLELFKANSRTFGFPGENNKMKETISQFT
jgi:hypothetical protein